MHWTQPEKQVPKLQDSCVRTVQLTEDSPECNSSQTTASLMEFRRGKAVAYTYNNKRCILYVQ